MLHGEVIGYLGADAEKRIDSAGREYISFNVAHSFISRKDNEERVVWIRVFTYQTDRYERFKKGAQVYVSGRLEIGSRITLSPFTIQILKAPAPKGNEH